MSPKKIVPNKFEEFLLNRNSLIEQYSKGDLSKEEFIEANYRCINALDIKPFQKIDNVKKAIYNYQYYNVLAKYYQKRAHDLSKKNAAREDFLEQSNYYYSRKDDVTMKLLTLIDFIGVESYYVKVKSPSLKKKLFEIVLLDYDNLILHSVNETILNRLIQENVFTNEEKKSLVDSYINQKY
ncbi:DUF6648 family protein [Acetivibrio cellulolyticus]|uniref:DUF6648 family protein n=1 Tax=Acetivibrio cellulolyticus TaxID=35830 RepID=UPI0001E2E75D|nr:DUF6648 family protein [Acetivibrio cellulolyticus]